MINFEYGALACSKSNIGLSNQDSMDKIIFLLLFYVIACSIVIDISRGNNVTYSTPLSYTYTIYPRIAWSFHLILYRYVSLRDSASPPMFAITVNDTGQVLFY